MTNPQPKSADGEPLEQFQDWWLRFDATRPKHPADSAYALARAGFYAGYASRPRPPIEPSRDALENTRYVPQRQRLADAPVPVPRPYPGHPGYGDGSADYVHQATVTAGRMPGTQQIESLYAGPTGETLERVHDELMARQQMKHTETVWNGTDGDLYGARGPVPARAGIEEAMDIRDQKEWFES